MNEHGNSNPEVIPEDSLRQTIQAAHEEFFEMVPVYDRSVWRPKDAIDFKRGSCMAELLYTAGTLLSDGIVKEDDITIGFSKDHGKMQRVGMTGKEKPYYAHAFMVVSLGPGRVYECDFRAYRADEKPRIQRLLPDEIDVDKTYLGPLNEAIAEYSRVEGRDVPTVSSLVGMHRRDHETPEQSGVIDDPVRFDEDF